ncbi:MAG: hypothetical protein ABI378_13990 [Chitinophagaceae bacterium]
MSVRRINAFAFIFVTILLDEIAFGIIIPGLHRLLSQLGHVKIWFMHAGWLLVIIQLCAGSFFIFTHTCWAFRQI